jgi:hypothetical protein
MRVFKAWADPDWSMKLTKTLTVSRIDEDIPVHKQRTRKPWYVGLTQTPDLIAKVGGVQGVPAGKTLLLSEADVIALVNYLLDTGTVELTESGAINPADWTGRERRRALAAIRSFQKQKARRRKR